MLVRGPPIAAVAIPRAAGSADALETDMSSLETKQTEKGNTKLVMQTQWRMWRRKADVLLFLQQTVIHKPIIFLLLTAREKSKETQKNETRESSTVEHDETHIMMAPFPPSFTPSTRRKMPRCRLASLTKTWVG